MLVPDRLGVEILCLTMGCHDTMAAMFSEHAEFLHGINDRVQDLMLPFFNGWYIDARFGGSASIKKVLPVLVPELSYDDLNIHEGASAQAIWMETALEGKNADQKQQIMRDMREYCKLDTLAMVEIFNYLQNQITAS